ncbi:uncharacterized protein LOC132556925 [Ylistrum balloti]|uniref:uncharacterized protein LOC132556925 n=1 Tax=Ylistrum balloti TaxID=509963 RepID=UPI002905E403|nr:uncharacterized protein LOC132556925 [Ylistrum balloti]
MNQPPPMQGPHMSHQQGPQMSGPNQQGPPMHGPHQQGPPMSGPHQQGPPGPHQQVPPMPGPRQQGPPMPGPHPHGPPMSGPLMQGPPMPSMQGPPMPRPHMQGPPMQNPPVSSATMNPAVALVGALLRQAAPQVLQQNRGPPGPQNMRPPGPQNMGTPGLQNMATPGPLQNMSSQPQGTNQTGPFNPQQGIHGPSGEKVMSPPHEPSPAPASQQIDDKSGEDITSTIADAKVEDSGRNMNDLVKTEQSETEPDKAGSEMTAAEEETNERKLSTLGLNLDTLTHLPAKQRELFLRIQNQQGDGAKDTQTENEDKIDKIPDEKMDDDNWYSSDEEDVLASKPKLTDILKNLSQKPTPESPQTPVPSNLSQSSTLDIMQMINSIRTQASITTVGTPDIPTNSNPPTFPKDSSMPAQATNSSPKSIPDPVIINSTEGDIPYKLRPITVDKSQQNKPPQGMDVHNAQFKNDPRIKKFYLYLESLPQKAAKPVKPVGSRPQLGPDPLEGTPKLDPRTVQPSDRRMDPRVKPRVDTAEGPRSIDPRFQGSERGQLLNIGMNKRQDIQKPLDPRMARQISRDGNPPDPRLGRQMTGQTFASSNGMMPDTMSRSVDARLTSQDPRKPPQDPRMGPQDPRMGPQDPRMCPPDPRMGLQDPRMGPQDPRMGQSDPRMGQDPRMGPQDPRMGPQGPKMGPQDPRMGSQDPRMGPQDPRMGPQGPKMGPQDPRMGSQDPRMGPQDPRMGSQDPRMGPQDPRMGSQDPRLGPQDPRMGLKDPRTNSDPRKVLQDVHSVADMEHQRLTDPRSLQRQGSVGADPRKLVTLDPRRPLLGDSTGQTSSDTENKKTEELDTKPKLDYRNDPRFKRKPASESVAHKRYTGQRKSSMDYSSPLGLDSEDKGESGYNSYQRPPPTDSAKHKTDNRLIVKGKLDPRTINTEGGSSPNVDSSPLPPQPPDKEIGLPTTIELPPFVTPNALEPQMKDFFKTMDPTASPFC